MKSKRLVRRVYVFVPNKNKRERSERTEERKDRVVQKTEKKHVDLLFLVLLLGHLKQTTEERKKVISFFFHKRLG